MKSYSTVAVACLLGLTVATPVEKRAMVVHTVTEQVVETVDITTTVWVKPTAGVHENYQLPKPKVNHNHGQHHQHHHKAKPKITTTSSAAYVAPVPVVPSTPTTTSTSSSVYIPPYTPPVVPTPVVPTPAYTPPAPTTPAPVVEPTTPAPSPSPVQDSGPSSGGSSGGSCGEIGGKCSGDITYYEAGLGACGWTNNGASEDVFALAHGMMGEQSNGNPFCGRMATIKVPGKPAVKAKLVDKCMGCEGQSIDLSNHLFDQLCDEATGRLHNVEWSFDS